jgi:hypothetical protein
MCPACIQSALLLVSGVGSAGAFAFIAARAFGRHARDGRREEFRNARLASRPGRADKGDEWLALTTGGP